MLLSPYLVTTTADMGPGSLYDAITQINADTNHTLYPSPSNPSVDEIDFNIPTSDPGYNSTTGTYTITPASALPDVNNSVIIDGWTQGGSGYTGPPLIELNGSAAGTGVDGLDVAAGNSTIRGLAINRFSGDALVLATKGGDFVTGDYLGTDPTGTIAEGNGVLGLYINNVGNNTIGGKDTNLSTAGVFMGNLAGAGNLISGNGQDGLQIAGASTNTVEGNYIGTDVTGTKPLGNGVLGIYISQAANNTIGGTTAGYGNVISGNLQGGLQIQGSSSTPNSTGNVVIGNFIGTNAAGTSALPNTILGVLINNGAANNTIGGWTTGARNIISGNGVGPGNGIGLEIGLQNSVSSDSSTTGNLVEGNYIGTNANGKGRPTNQVQVLGILITNGANNNTIGGQDTNSPGTALAGAGNLISGNGQDGLEIAGASTNTVEGNYIGTDVTGNNPLGNGVLGIYISQAANNTIGGTTAGYGNVISGNLQGGLQIQGSSSTPNSTGNLVEGNFIGTNAAGTSRLPNTILGVLINNGAANNTIGGRTTGARNIISGNGVGPGNGIGVEIGAQIPGSSDSSTTGNLVEGNFIGTNAAGTKSLGNAILGVEIYQASSNTIGGQDTNSPGTALAGAGNLISGNGQDGLEIADSTATTNNKVQGNYIGTDVTGTKALGNRVLGVYITQAANNTIGDTTAGYGNVISGNLQGGLQIQGSSSTPNSTGNLVEGNFIGTNAAGTSALPNTILGVLINNGAANNTIGGNTTGARNIISGNGVGPGNGIGLQISGSSDLSTTGNLVEGNYIGTKASGSSGFPNQLVGVLLTNGANTNTIGGSTTGARNIISANGGDGLQIAGATLNLVQGNFIGSNPSGTNLGNGSNGVDILAGSQSNTIGSPLNSNSTALGNTIAFNKRAGVLVQDATSTGNSIRLNSIFGNTGLGIDLGPLDGVDLNHVSDSLPGPNNLQNYPIITNATAGSSTSVSGTFNSLPSATYTLDFYANSSADVSFFGVTGKSLGSAHYLGSATVTTDTYGYLHSSPDGSASITNADTPNATFMTTLSATTSGQWITATATDQNDGDTSEFSQARQLPATAITTINLSSSRWTAIGPSPIAYDGFDQIGSTVFSRPVLAGRVSVAVPDPNHSNVMYIGTDGGGIWKTTQWNTASPTWTPLTDNQTSLNFNNISYQALAFFPVNSTLVDGDLFAAMSGPGGGILEGVISASSNGSGSITWNPIMANSSGSVVSGGSSYSFDSVFFGSLVIDPTNPSNLFVSVWGGSAPGGIYESTNGGQSWTNTTATYHIGAASDVVMDPTNPSILYAGLVQDSTNASTNGIWQSTDGGASWTQLTQATNGVLSGPQVGPSIRLALSDNPAQAVYATVFDTTSTPHRFVSFTGGASWSALAALPGNDETRIWHAVLSVDPNNSNIVYVNGDHTLYRSTNYGLPVTGGSTWTMIFTEDPVGGAFDDTGAFVMVGDGGIYRWSGPGSSFQSEQGNLQNAEFYTLTLDPTNPTGTVYGVAQDQPRALKLSGAVTGTNAWNLVGSFPAGTTGQETGQEVGKILVNPNNPATIYSYDPFNLNTTASSLIFISHDGGATWTTPNVTNVPTTVCDPNTTVCDTNQSDYYLPQKSFVMDPSNPNHLLVGTIQVYETTDGGNTWTAISGAGISSQVESESYADQYITALAIAHPTATTTTIYAATADGRFFSTQNDGLTWTEGDPPLIDPANLTLKVVSIQVDPNSTNNIFPNYIFMVPGTFPTNVFGSSHVWMTTTGGAPPPSGGNGWTDIGTTLPKEFFTNSIAVDWRPSTPVLYVATARGVYESTNLGVAWSLVGMTPSGPTLPNAVVTDLQFVPSFNVLAAATFGRGVFEIDPLGPATPGSAPARASAKALDSLGQGLSADGGSVVHQMLADGMSSRTLAFATLGTPGATDPFQGPSPTPLATDFLEAPANQVNGTTSRTFPALAGLSLTDLSKSGAGDLGITEEEQEAWLWLLEGQQLGDAASPFPEPV